jgi:hypothetical protein
MMKISGYAFFAGAAIAVAAAMGGCSSSSSSPGSALSADGESCSRSSDCGSGLVCIQDTCVTKGTVINDAGQVIGVDGGVVAPPVPDGSVVVTTPDGSVVIVPAEAAPPPRLSAQGEYCMTASDCATGLICVPNSPVYGGSGVCDLATFGLTPSGKTCSGECNMAADCCQLPIGTSVGNTAVKTCEDILNVVLTGNTTQCTQAPSPTSAVGIGCFLYSTYCSSCATGSTWACTKSQCVYNASCQNSGVELNGCPSMTRTGRALNTNCDVPSNTCKPAAVAGACVSMDSECDTKPTSDTSYTCRGGDCTCYQTGCYLKCSSDLNCRQGYNCNTTTKLCTQTAGCSTNADCAASTAVVTAQCVTGQCKIPCATDHQCSSSGLIKSQFAASFGGQVCGADHFCATLGCANDTDCQNSGSNPGGNTVHLFCVTPPAATTTPVFQSAITN